MKHTLDNHSQVFFYEQDHYYLSNFSAFRLRYGNVDYDTSEHAYHCQKFIGGDPTPIDLIRACRSAHDAFKTAEHFRAQRRPDWDLTKVDVMRCILVAKVQQHEYVARKLLQTGDRILIENSWRDDFWGWGPNRDGKNMLGVLWMQVRTQMRLQIETSGTP